MDTCTKLNSPDKEPTLEGEGSNFQVLSVNTKYPLDAYYHPQEAEQQQILLWFQKTGGQGGLGAH